MSSIYKKTCKALSDAKKDNDKEKIKKTLIDFFDIIKNIADNAEINTYYDFIVDKNFIFKNKILDFNKSKADIVFFSDGLLKELLDVLDIKNSSQISEKIFDSINDFHSAISRDEKITLERNNLKYMLDENRKMIEDMSLL